MVENSIPELDQNERTMAALLHGSVIFPFVGAVVPLLYFFFKKDKSNYLSFHALQAAAFQVSIILIWVIGGLCYTLLIFATTLSLPLVVSETGNTTPAIWVASIVPFLVIGAILILAIAYCIYGIVGAIRTYQGKVFSYIIFGKLAEKIIQSRKAEKSNNNSATNA